MLAFGMPAPQEMIFIAFILVLLFGARKLPELARSVGTSVLELKKGLRDVEDVEQEVHEAPRAKEAKQ